MSLFVSMGGAPSASRLRPSVFRTFAAMCFACTPPHHPEFRHHLGVRVQGYLAYKKLHHPRTVQ